MDTLLSRDDFREAVFKRDEHKCVICGAPAKDAHHIIERRLFPDGGYYLSNGASLCEQHHIAAEETTLTCEEVRSAARIMDVKLPPDLYPDSRYDKWGDVYISETQRLEGPLFRDPSVQKIIRGEFLPYVKYPRTFHVPFSPGGTKDDRYLPDLGMFIGRECVITEKMDGENTSLYSDKIHARSFDYASHPSRDRMKALFAERAHDIPSGFRICGENVYAEHSIHYNDLESFFLVFSVWQGLTCLNWDETLEWCSLLGLSTVPLLWEGKLESSAQLKQLTDSLSWREGYVIRVRASFQLSEFSKAVGKYVRKDHVQTSHHWKHEQVKPNALKP